MTARRNPLPLVVANILGGVLNRDTELERLYDGLTVFARRARELGAELHPDLSLVAFTVLSYIETRPDARAADLVSDWGLDKSTVSRQLTDLTTGGLLTRTGRRPGRRGQVLEMTDEGRAALANAANSIRTLLFDQLSEWSDRDIATFARLITRFNGAVPT